MRDRLVELIGEARSMEASGIDCKVSNEYIADHLLAEGVIVPPVKVGQAVYYPIRHTNKVEQLFVREIVYTVSKIQFYASYLSFTVEDIGKTIFLTKSQAEEAIKNEQEKL